MNNTSHDDLADYMRCYGLERSDLYEAEGASITAGNLDYRVDRPSAFPIEADRCALIVIDMQDGFVDPDSPQWIPQATRIIPPLAAFAETCRQAGIPVILTSANTLHPSPNDAQRYCVAMADGNLGHNPQALEITPELRKEGDYVIGTKRTYDSFYGTDLEMQLRSRGRDTIIITGTMTNYCCEATARSGFDRGYHVVFTSDLTATDSALCHEATLQTMRRGYARVVTGDQVLDEMQSRRRAVA